MPQLVLKIVMMKHIKTYLLSWITHNQTETCMNGYHEKFSCPWVNDIKQYFTLQFYTRLQWWKNRMCRLTVTFSCHQYYFGSLFKCLSSFNIYHLLHGLELDELLKYYCGESIRLQKSKQETWTQNNILVLLLWDIHLSCLTM